MAFTFIYKRSTIAKYIRFKMENSKRIGFDVFKNISLGIFAMIFSVPTNKLLLSANAQ